MGKGIEAELPVILSHTGISHAAEAHARGSKMDYRIINTASAKRAASQHALLHIFILRKKIQRKRFRPWLYEFYRFIKVFPDIRYPQIQRASHSHLCDAPA
jgi:hypothetical protein